ncbi:gene transfer agent family protein [bacterium AH-315-P15]|nr:gene transfer agent family protein [bacterium AH-315-P15]
MVNAARGEVALELGGRAYCLCLTMGALAEIETALGAKDLNDMDARLKAVRAEDLVQILHALMKGGGESLSLEETRALPLNVMATTAAIGQAFQAAGVRAEQPQAQS